MTSFAIFGTIFLANDVREEDLEDTLNHEYGHTVQEKEYGFILYWKFVAEQSLMHRGGNDSVYYSRWWEYGADVAGNVDRECYLPGTHERWEKKHALIMEIRKITKGAIPFL